MAILRISWQKFDTAVERYEIISLISLYVAFLLNSLVVFCVYTAHCTRYYRRVRGHASFDGSMDYSSVNCMQEARILTVMFQQGNDVVSFKEANFFLSFSSFFVSFSF